MTKGTWIFMGVFGVLLFIKWWFWLSPWSDKYWEKKDD